MARVHYIRAHIVMREEDAFSLTDAASEIDTVLRHELAPWPQFLDLVVEEVSTDVYKGELQLDGEAAPVVESSSA